LASPKKSKEKKKGGSRSAGALVEGRFRTRFRGGGMLIPDDAEDRRMITISPNRAGAALPGDRVAARVGCRGKRGGRMVYAGEVMEILERRHTRYVGRVVRDDQGWWLEPDGREVPEWIFIDDAAGRRLEEDLKVAVSITTPPEDGALPRGRIVAVFGHVGDLEAEIGAIACSHDLPGDFDPDILSEAERAALRLSSASGAAGREDLTGVTVVTVDPDDARDYDDALSLKRSGRDGDVILGVHIADVSHFVVEGTTLDAEARDRGTSAYFPRRVIPMLPPVLSNGACSLVEGEPRLAKSVFLRYDRHGRRLETRFAETVISSRARLTYGEAQAICDGDRGGRPAPVVSLVRGLERLARKIERRRLEAGMLRLDLAERELVFDEGGRVVDAVPGDDAYSHTMIEMFMVEANEAVAELLGELGVTFIARSHPEPEEVSLVALRKQLAAMGHTLPRRPGRRDLAELLDRLREKEGSEGASLAVLRAFEAAEYTTRATSHFALASGAYCHFTSPIRRYPDLTVHRALARFCREGAAQGAGGDAADLERLAAHCTALERRAEKAERELEAILVLQHLEGKVGAAFTGTVTGITDQGLFIRHPRFPVDGMLRYDRMGGAWWEVSASFGLAQGQKSGMTYRLGDAIEVRISAVDVPRRHLDLELSAQGSTRQ
jgi:ribonuclease R